MSRVSAFEAYMNHLALVDYGFEPKIRAKPRTNKRVTRRIRKTAKKRKK